MLTIHQVSGGYTNHPVIKDVSLSIAKGEFFGILGPNGSGKTTLLKMISGLLPCTEGSIRLGTKKVSQFSRKELAQKMAVLPQLTPHAFPYTVRETIALGRYAHHRGLFQTWTEQDEAVLQKIMQQTNTEHFAEESLYALSGGEQQRVYLAQALAQQPDILLLDEPTNHLDLAHQKDLLDLLKKSTEEQGLTVISIFHDLNLASLYCGRLLLMENGQTKMLNMPAHVLIEPIIREVYQTAVKNYPHPEIAKPQIHLLPERNRKLDEAIIIDDNLLHIKPEQIVLRSPIPLRTFSTGICGGGIGWHSLFINRRVDNNYNSYNRVQEMQDDFISEGLHAEETVAMLTAANLQHVAWDFWKEDDFSLLIVITVVIDSATENTGTVPQSPGNIHTWIFVNGTLTDEAHIQTITTATEAKTQVLRDIGNKDKATDAFATGNSTDNITVAATQRGVSLPCTGTATRLGRAVHKMVYQKTKKAIANALNDNAL